MSIKRVVWFFAVCTSALFSFVTVQKECVVTTHKLYDNDDNNTEFFHPAGYVVNTNNVTTPFEQVCVDNIIATYTSIILAIGLLFLLFLLTRQPQSNKKLSFKVRIIIELKNDIKRKLKIYSL